MNMKKYLLLSAVACTLAGCSNDFNPADVVIDQNTNTDIKEAPIGFSASNSNMLRATGLEQSHYNFGVFAYKDTEPTYPIMEDYLVGYMDAAGKKGYKLSESNQTTLGDVNSTENKKSYWAYEKLGNAEYSLANNQENEHYYTTGTSDKEKFYLSNNTNQYLRYWDKSSRSTNFYAYAPYYHHDSETGVTFDNLNHKLTLPIGAIQAGTDDATKYEAMYAAKNVTSTNYETDVALEFKRLVSKIRIAFWEDIAGYGVTIEPLKTDLRIVSAVPAKEESSTHKYGAMLETAGISINFTDANYETATIAINDYTGTNYPKENDTKGAYISFQIPDGATTADTGHENPIHRIATTKASIGDNDYSKTIYYGIPKNGNVGLTFHVTFKLHSTTGETILVKDATVHVPGTDCQWDPNKQYTYFFKITKNTTGTTEDKPDGEIDPGSSKVNGQALYPIVFDGCTVEEWDANTDSEHTIN